MIRCRACGHEVGEGGRFCVRCGSVLGSTGRSSDREAEELNLPVLYAMAVALCLAVLFPPWEAPPGQPPQFLGFHFILNPPDMPGDGAGTGIISRLLVTVELTTIAVAGLYFAWLFRKVPGQ
jgi:hypothetical protein